MAHPVGPVQGPVAQPTTIRERVSANLSYALNAIKNVGSKVAEGAVSLKNRVTSGASTVGSKIANVASAVATAVSNFFSKILGRKQQAPAPKEDKLAPKANEVNADVNKNNIIGDLNTRTLRTRKA